MATEDSISDYQEKTLEDMLFAITSPLYVNNTSDMTGSGFFYFESPKRNTKEKKKKYEDIWLVTNSHVLFGTDVTGPDRLSEIRFRTRRKTLSGSPSWNRLVICGEDLKGRIRLSHDANEDVAVVKVTDEIEKVHPDIDQGYGFFAVSDILFPDKSSAFVEVGDDVIVVGYPRGIYDEENLFPIVRSSCIATRWGAHVNGFRYFLLDRKHHPGSSGSIVITKPTVIESSITKQFLFLGIYEGELYRNKTPTDTSKVWYGSLVKEIVNNGKTWVQANP
ncbi:MAG TPA: serine protease [Candidatus Bathyarchaeia archaeon]|nr:serine protease [Candidatus Bathyarchaeia archaeon]